MDLENRISLPENLVVPDEVKEAADGDELIAAILVKRGICDPIKVRQFLHPDEYQPFDPRLYPGIQGALKLLWEAVEKGLSVAIYGDYDVDGVTATSLLMQGLKPFMKKLTYHVPDRFTEGYGLNSEVIEKMAAEGVQLVITCDCGIASQEEIALARRLGMKVLVTDHHTPPEELPKADGILNPKLLQIEHPLYFLPGVGVAYMLLRAFYSEMGAGMAEEDFLDLVALGIIADVVPLLGECRYLLKRGLPYLLEPRRPGLAALYEQIVQSSSILTEEDIAFQLAPRINAAGRLESADLPIELLLTADAGRAAELAGKLEELNGRRKKIQNEIIMQGIEMVEAEQKEQGILVLFKPDWHHGVIGIAAGRLCEEYKRPVICLSLKEDGQTVVGSARSVEDISIYDILVQCGGYLTKFGGHAQAAGLSLTLENLQPFKEFVQKLVPYKEGDREMMPEPDAKVPLDLIDMDFYHRVRKLAPFGEAFPPPVFESDDVEVLSDRLIGSTRHHRMIIRQGSRRHTALWWWGEEAGFQGRRVDLLYTLNLSEWKSEKRLNLVVCGWNPKSPVQAQEKERPAVLWIDRSLSSLDSVIREFPDGQIFYEGTSKWPWPVSNRYNIRKSDVLILKTIPPTPDILREILAASEAKKLVLSVPETDEPLSSFLKRSMGILKHVLTQRQGWIELSQLVSLLAVSEGLAELLLLFLTKEKRLTFQWEDPLLIQIRPYQSGQEEMKVPKDIEKLLFNAYYEMLAFRRYIKREGQEKINELLW